jgi:2,4-dienoyl-CoA reductase-like NADH-dependent reductase (Old Yellow Enzyme family)
MKPADTTLFDPFAFENGIYLRNRIVMAPMTARGPRLIHRSFLRSRSRASSGR